MKNLNFDAAEIGTTKLYKFCFNNLGCINFIIFCEMELNEQNTYQFIMMKRWPKIEKVRTIQ